MTDHLSDGTSETTYGDNNVKTKKTGQFAYKTYRCVVPPVNVAAGHTAEVPPSGLRLRLTAPLLLIYSLDGTRRYGGYHF